MAFSLECERDFEFPRIIVWDALVDPELVSGWLGEASIVPELGGDFSITWHQRPGHPTTVGSISALQSRRLLVVQTDDAGVVRFDLTELPGGSRGTSTNLRVTVELEMERAFAARVWADWRSNLDQLEDLLRGHPVDWQHWERDRQPIWTSYLDERRASGD